MGTPAKKETHTHTLNSTTLAHITHADRLTANLPKILHTSRKLTEFPPVKRNKKKRLQTLSKNPRAPAIGGNSSSFHLLRPHNPKFFPVKIAESATKRSNTHAVRFISRSARRFASNWGGLLPGGCDEPRGAYIAATSGTGSNRRSNSRAERKSTKTHNRRLRGEDLDWERERCLRNSLSLSGERVGILSKEMSYGLLLFRSGQGRTGRKMSGTRFGQGYGNAFLQQGWEEDFE